MKIFAGKLPKDITEEDLRSTFEEYGHVTSVYIIRENKDGDDYLYGLIEMPVNKQANLAIESLDGKEMKGVKLSIHEARVGLKDRRRSGRGGGRRKDDSPEAK